MGCNDKANRLYYLARGLCPRCGGKSRVEDGRSMCAECRHVQDVGHETRVAQWKEQDRCTRCGRERDNMRWKLCQACRTYCAGQNRKNAEKAKARREAQREKGFCVRCGKTWAEPGRAACKKCLTANAATMAKYQEKYPAQAAKRRNARKAAGLCIDCGAPAADGHVRCARCLAMRRDSWRKYAIRQRMKREGVVL